MCSNDPPYLTVQFLGATLAEHGHLTNWGLAALALAAAAIMSLTWYGLVLGDRVFG